MILLVFSFQVVVADNVERVCERLRELLPQKVLFAAEIRVLETAGQAVLPLAKRILLQLVVEPVPEGADAIRDRAARVKFPDKGCQSVRKLVTVSEAGALGDFISGGPDGD